MLKRIIQFLGSFVICGFFGLGVFAAAEMIVYVCETKK
jgi:hypothetical protein